MDCLTDFLICATAAQIPVHSPIDIRIARIRRSCEQCRRRHDLAGLAVPALRDIRFDPCSLDRMIAVGR